MSPQRPNPRWSRPPPLRFNEVALPAGAAVSQVGHARGGGWGRLSLAVSPLSTTKGVEQHENHCYKRDQQDK